MATITGGPSSDSLVGTSSSDHIDGLGGADIITGRAGDDVIDGGPGKDVAVFSGGSGGYLIGIFDGELYVDDVYAANGDDGKDTLKNVETLRFSDGDFSVGLPTQGPMGEFAVSTGPGTDQWYPNLVANADGGFEVTYYPTENFGQIETPTIFGKYLQQYDADGQSSGPATKVSDETTGAPRPFRNQVARADFADGSYVTAKVIKEGRDSDIAFDLFDASGVALETDILVNQKSLNSYGGYPSVYAAPDGGFVVIWLNHAASGDGWGYSLSMRRYDADGIATTDEVPVSETPNVHQFEPSAAFLEDGDLVISWTSGKMYSYSIHAQRFTSDLSPIGVKITGDASSDKIYSGTGSQSIFALGGDDFLNGGPGADFLDGGSGTDTAIYSGPRKSYSVKELDDGSIKISDDRVGSPIASPDGIDTVANVESFKFSDGTYTEAQLLGKTDPIDKTDPVEPQSHLPVAFGGTATITTNFLLSYDADGTGALRSPDEVTYVVDEAPHRGTLLLHGEETSTFTQADIDNGFVQYRQDGDAAPRDSFQFTVYDPAGNHTEQENFTIVMVGSDGPMVDTNNHLVAQVGSPTPLFPHLSTVAIDHEPQELTYMLVKAPDHGALIKDGMPTTTFTQLDIDYDGLAYLAMDGSVMNDSFAFVVFDSDGSRTDPQGFHIAFAPPGEAMAGHASDQFMPFGHEPMRDLAEQQGSYWDWG